MTLPDEPKRTMNFWPALYGVSTRAAAPLVARYLERRCRLGKEDAERLPERFGFTSAARPPGPLLWLHAASVGEANSVLALIDRIVHERPGIEILMTTGTVAAARILAARLPPSTRHQFAPVDVPQAVERFLDHWRPNLAIWVESELWPNLMIETRGRGVPMLLVNARMSAGSLARWRLLPGLARPVMATLSLCLAQDEAQAERFRELGAAQAESVGDLKAAAPPLGADPVALTALRQQIGARPIWLAASTHPGEEEVVAAAHAAIAQSHPDLLTVVVPRHPVRAAAIAEMLRDRRLRTARRTTGGPITADTDVYLADTFGELGLFYRLAEIVFVGGSMVRKGGHNPFEAARLGCAILHGPDMTNCAAMAHALDAGDAALAVGSAAELAIAVLRLLAAPEQRSALADNAALIAAQGGGTLDAVLDRCRPWLDALVPLATMEIAPAMRRLAANASP